MKYIALAGVLAVSAASGAQSFNLDFGGTTSPNSSYGAAAGQTGVWQNINSLTANVGVIMNDLSGAATVAELSSTTNQTSFFFNNGLTSGDDENLLDDQFDLGLGGNDSFTITNLANGVYNVYIYAWPSDDDGAFVDVDLIGNGVQTCGGTYAGLATGVTHGEWLNVVVTGNTLNFRTTNVVGFGSLNGMQIEQVPEPATMAVLGLGALVAIRRRRSK